MKLQVIKTDKGYLAVSDEKLKRDDWGIDLTESLLTKCLRTEENSYWNKNCKKIIATDTSFKLEGIPQFELEDSVETQDWYKKAISVLEDEHSIKMAKLCLKAGYKAAQEKGCYTEEDLIKAIRFGKDLWKDVEKQIKNGHKQKLFVEDFIQSLKQPKQLVGIELDSLAIAGYTQEGDTCVKEMFKMIISKEHPDGLLTVKKYYYE